MLLSSERRILQKHLLIIVSLWSFCSLEMNILAWAFCPFSLWGDMSSPRGYLWSRNWQNLSNLTCVTSERSRPQWEEQLWVHLHSLASLGTKAHPPPPRQSLHCVVHLFPFIASKLTRRLRKKSQFFAPVSSGRYSQPVCDVDWSLSHREKEELLNMAGPSPPFQQIGP